MIAPLEILMPRFALTSLRVSFTGIAWYDQPVRLILKVTPTEPLAGKSSDALTAVALAAPALAAAATTALVAATDATLALPELEIEAVAMQGDRESLGEASEGGSSPTPRASTSPNARSTELGSRASRAFFGSLGIAPQSYFDKPEGRDLSYPYAFLASLPSGEMVERLSGQGGILNRLTLEFDADKLPIAGPPEVSLELPERLRKSFNKIVTRIKEGMLTAVRGSALILPKSDVPADILSSLESGPAPRPKSIEG